MKIERQIGIDLAQALTLIRMKMIVRTDESFSTGPESWSPEHGDALILFHDGTGVLISSSYDDDLSPTTPGNGLQAPQFTYILTDSCRVAVVRRQFPEFRLPYLDITKRANANQLVWDPLLDVPEI